MTKEFTILYTNNQDEACKALSIINVFKSEVKAQAYKERYERVIQTTLHSEQLTRVELFDILKLRSIVTYQHDDYHASKEALEVMQSIAD